MITKDELKTQLKFVEDLLEKKIEDNFKLRQEIIELRKKLNLIPEVNLKPDGKK
tara:strand:+ start:4407 stop:4568 length:162 start_codon:yes stop_codon:yes gene_type:complete